MPEAAGRIAKRRNIEDSQFVADLMNSLYEDTHVQTLWRLWQTRVATRPLAAAADSHGPGEPPEDEIHQSQIKEG